MLLAQLPSARGGALQVLLLALAASVEALAPFIYSIF